MDWYKFNLQSYLRMTANLFDAEDLAFRRMIDIYYLKEGPLPLDHAEIETLVGLDWDCIEPVLKNFFHPTPHGYVNYTLKEDVDRRKDLEGRAAKARLAKRKKDRK